jgi:predicted nucleic-acid-binding protein
VIAVDTNVLIRLLTADNPQQVQAAKRLFESGPVWIAKTVLLETAWVLRSAYSFEDAAIGNAFRNLLGLENVHAEDESSIATAVELMRHGIDFADAIHLASCPPGARFVSFDQALVRRARRAGVASITVI